jgi:hypothetical protein
LIHALSRASCGGRALTKIGFAPVGGLPIRFLTLRVQVPPPHFKRPRGSASRIVEAPAPDRNVLGVYWLQHQERVDVLAAKLLGAPPLWHR